MEKTSTIFNAFTALAMRLKGHVVNQTHGSTDARTIMEESIAQQQGIFLARQRLDVYAPLYNQHSFYPANSIAIDEVDRSHFIAAQKTAIVRLVLCQKINEGKISQGFSPQNKADEVLVKTGVI